MPDEVLIAAEAYALHQMSCKVCSANLCEICDEGLRLMQFFQDALHAMLNARVTKQN